MEEKKNDNMKATITIVNHKTGGETKIDLFNDDDFNLMREKFKEIDLDAFNKMDELYDEAWIRWSKDHPEFERPAMCPVIDDSNTWGMLITDPDESSSKRRMLLNYKMTIQCKDDEHTKDVIYHELCHLIYHESTEDNAGGHPREFWDELEKYDHKFIEQKKMISDDADKRINKLLQDIEGWEEMV